MIYLKWLILIPISFSMVIVNFFLSPILPLFMQKNGYLPKWLSWFQTPDNPLDGDRGHKKRWPKNGIFWSYIRRVAWLLRNPCYGFDETICGVLAKPTDLLTEEGVTNASDVRGISGSCIRHLYRDGKHIAFHWYYVKHYKMFGYKACIRISLGWKLWNPECFQKQFTCYFHPTKKFQKA